MKSRIFEEQYGRKHIAEYVQLPLWLRLLAKFSKHRLQVASGIIPMSKFSVLDIGCGDGTFLYANREKWNEIVGVDILPFQLSKAKKKKFPCPARFMQKDFGRERMPFKNNHFDVCVSIATLQYIYDIDMLFDEIHRVLKKGGSWIFEIPNITVFWRRFDFLRGRLPKTSHYTNAWDAGTIHYFTYHDMKEFCVKKGFSIQSVRTSGFMSSIRSLWPDMLGADLVFECRKV